MRTTKGIALAIVAVGALMGSTMVASAQSACGGPTTMWTSNPRSISADNDANQVHGRDRFAIAAAFRDKGIRVRGFEAWGSHILAQVVDDNCQVYTEYFDPDTLTPVTPGWR